MQGETIELIYRKEVGVDEFEAPVYEFNTISVGNVLVSSSSSSDIEDKKNPDGDETTIILIFPKAFTDSVRNATATVRGRNFRIQGDPLPFNPETTPTKWNRSVKAVEINA